MRFFLSVVIVTAIGAASAQVATRSAPSSTFSTAVSSTEQTSSSASVNSSTPLVLSQRTGSSHFAKVDGLKFNIDGESKYFAGTNLYWLPFLTNNADVDSVFKNLKNSGLKILRVWGFNDVNAVPKPGTVTSSSTTLPPCLDYVVSAAEKYGIKLIIPFVNYWDDYGGMNAYVTAYGGSKTGWYSDKKIQSVYQAYIKAVVSRYKTSSAIFAWELANEPRCPGCTTDVISNWVAKTAAYIKSLDCNHMVTTGEEGMGLTVGSDGSYPYGYSEGNDFAKNLGALILTLECSTSTSPTWIKAHAKICDNAKKPCLFEEYGIKNDHCSDSVKWQKTALDTTGIAADLFWQYGEQLSTGPSPNDHYTIYYGTDDWRCGVADHVKQINSGGV